MVPFRRTAPKHNTEPLGTRHAFSLFLGLVFVVLVSLEVDFVNTKKHGDQYLVPFRMFTPPGHSWAQLGTASPPQCSPQCSQGPGTVSALPFAPCTAQYSQELDQKRKGGGGLASVGNLRGEMKLELILCLWFISNRTRERQEEHKLSKS